MSDFSDMKLSDIEERADIDDNWVIYGPEVLRRCKELEDNQCNQWHETLSAAGLINYGETPEEGVKSIMVLVDVEPKRFKELENSIMVEVASGLKVSIFDLMEELKAKLARVEEIAGDMLSSDDGYTPAKDFAPLILEALEDGDE